MKLLFTLLTALFIVSVYAAFLTGFVYARHVQVEGIARYLE